LAARVNVDGAFGRGVVGGPSAATSRGAMEQTSLFTLPAVVVPGLTLVRDWIGAAEEARLLELVDSEPWDVSWRRRRQLYGAGYGGVGRPFPRWLQPLAQRLADESWLPRPAESSVINEYVPGIGIAAHRDDMSFGDSVAAVSIGGDIVLDFYEPSSSTKAAVSVPARSLWVITGPARTSWQHGIAARHADVVDGVKVPRKRRISLTFRTRRL
jgi:hypothetical protein